MQVERSKRGDARRCPPEAIFLAGQTRVNARTYEERESDGSRDCTYSSPQIERRRLLVNSALPCLSRSPARAPARFPSVRFPRLNTAEECVSPKTDTQDTSNKIIENTIALKPVNMNTLNFNPLEFKRRIVCANYLDGLIKFSLKIYSSFWNAQL